jgi:hypothetical protein
MLASALGYPHRRPIDLPVQQIASSLRPARRIVALTKINLDREAM